MNNYRIVIELYRRFFPNNSRYYLAGIFFATLLIMLSEVLSITALPVLFGPESGDSDRNAFLSELKVWIYHRFDITGNSFTDNLLIFCFIFLLKNILTIALRFCANYWLLIFSAHFEKNLFASTIERDIRSLNGLNKTQVTQTFAVELQNIRTYFLTPLINFVIELLLAISLVTLLLLLIDTSLILPIIGFCVFSATIIHLVSKLSDFLGKRRVALQEKFLVPIKDFLEGYVTVKSFGQSSRYNRAFADASHKLNTVRAQSVTISASAANIIEILLVGFIPIAYSLSVLAEQNLDMASLATYSLIVYRLYPSLSRMTNYLNRMKNGYGSLAFVTRFLRELPVQNNGEINTSFAKTDSAGEEFSIALEKVYYKTSEGRYLFEGLSLTLPRRGIVQIKGANGVGKSSLISLIVGLNKPDAGFITRASYLKADMISYASQTPFLEQATLAENVNFSNLTEELGVLDQLLEVLSFGNFFHKYKGSKVGDGGLNLSGGQKQKINILRSLLTQPAVLVLDEPFAALDRQTKERLWHYLDQFARTNLLIIVSHEELERVDSVVAL